MSLGLTPDTGLIPSFPRVSGDEPIEAVADQAYTLFSPRERG